MKTLTLLFLTISVALSSSAFAKPLKIGYINIDHVVSTSPQFIEANQVVLKEFKPREKKLLKLRESIATRIKKMQKNKDSLSKKDIQSEFKKISTLESDLKQKAAKLQQEFKLKNTKELRKIEDSINKIIKDVAKKKNFDLILYQEVAYASEEINITTIISEKLRALFK